MRGIFTASQAAQLARAACGEINAADEREPRTACGGTIADEISALEISRYMRNQLLRDSDVMSMANKLELRVPFVDSEFIDRVTRIPADQRIRPGKKTLLEAVPEVPEWVANAPKRGFRFPFENWITDSWTEGSNLAARATVRPSSWYQRWTIFVFERWVRDVMRP